MVAFSLVVHRRRPGLLFSLIVLLIACLWLCPSVLRLLRRGEFRKTRQDYEKDYEKEGRLD